MHAAVRGVGRGGGDGGDGGHRRHVCVHTRCGGRKRWWWLSLFVTQVSAVNIKENKEWVSGVQLT